jgi:hypothetical protein
MRLMLIVTAEEQDMLIQILGEKGRQMMNGSSVQENSKLKSIENIIQQLAFGRDHDES